MKAFADLYTALDETTKTTRKVQALVDYFGRVSAADAAWAVYFLIGRKPRQVVPMPKLRAWAIEAAGIPDWLFQESYDAVGDIAETIALLLPASSRIKRPATAPLGGRSLAAAASDAGRRSAAGDPRSLADARSSAAVRLEQADQRRIPRGGLAAACDQGDRRRRAHRPGRGGSPLDGRLGAVGRVLRGPARPRCRRRRHQPAVSLLSWPIRWKRLSNHWATSRQWQAEWKWDGIRSQLIRRGGQTFLWSRGEELVTERYPELAAVGDALPDGTVIDGEILPFKDGHVLPFTMLQKRIGRKAVTKSILSQVPVVIMAFDLLEHAGADLRPVPLEERRGRLAAIISALEQEFPGLASRLRLSPVIAASSWSELADDPGQQPRARGRGPDAQAARARPTAWAGAGATGGSGRSSRTRSTPC